MTFLRVTQSQFLKKLEMKKSSVELYLVHTRFQKPKANQVGYLEQDLRVPLILGSQWWVSL